MGSYWDWLSRSMDTFDLFNNVYKIRDTVIWNLGDMGFFEGGGGHREAESSEGKAGR